MKIKFTILKFLVILSGTVAATAVFGQVANYTWTGAADGTNLDTPGNFTTDGVTPATTLPSGNDGSGTQESVIWNGRTTTNLNLTYSFPGWNINNGLGSFGVNLVLTSNQTNSMQIISLSAASPGMNVFAITNNSPHSSLIFGDNTTNDLTLITRPGMTGTIHPFINNSTAPIIINSNVEWKAGGGVGYVYDLQGTGNWAITNDMTPDNGASSPITFQMDGSGTVFWKAGKAGVYNPNTVFSNMNINNGTVILKSSFPDFHELSNTVISVTTTLDYDPVTSDSQTLNGVISGIGKLIVNNGTLILGAWNTYSGGTVISNGVLQVTNTIGPPLGTGNIINNSALVFSQLNNQFINNNISGSGSVSNINSGTCALSGSNTYSGSTTISAGKLAFQGVKTGAGNITVADNAALDVYDTGTQVMPNTLTLGSSTGCTLEFFLSGTNSNAIISAGTLSSAGTIAVNILNVPPPLAVGQSYPLLTWAGGSAPTVQLGGLSFFVGNLSIVGNTLWLNITGTIAGTVYTWTGAADGTNLATAGDWTTNGTTPATTLPSGLTRDTAQWDGATASNQILTYPSPGWPNTGGFTFGVNLVTTTNQTNSVQIISPVAQSPLIGIFGITNNSPHSSLILGDNTANDLKVVTRPGVTGIIHPFINNSAAPIIINPNVEWEAGGGVGYVYDLQGTGNWAITNDMTPDNGAVGPITFQMDGTGTVFWSAGKAGIYNPNTRFANLNVNAGTIILKSSFPDVNELNNTAISIATVLDYDPVNSDSQTFNGVISGTGQLIVNNGTLTLGGNNTYSGGTVISNGILQVGTNGASGSLGSGTVTNNSSLIFNRSDSATFGNVISGTGSVVQQGSGTLTLNGANTYTGATKVSNGTLVVSSVGGDVDANGGTLVAGGLGSVGTLTIGGNLNISSGTVVAALNKASSPSNSIISVVGAINSSGGILKLLNFGPTLAIGDKFTLFNKAVTGAAMTIISPGFTVANNLAVDGSVTVTAVTSSPATVSATVLGGQLNLSWPAAWTGLHLQVQTNTLAVGLSTNWVTIPGSDAGNNFSAAVISSNAVFYRLAP